MRHISSLWFRMYHLLSHTPLWDPGNHSLCFFSHCIIVGNSFFYKGKSGETSLFGIHTQKAGCDGERPFPIYQAEFKPYYQSVHPSAIVRKAPQLTLGSLIRFFQTKERICLLDWQLTKCAYLRDYC